MAEKANPTADISQNFVAIPPGTTYRNGREFDPGEGGIAELPDGSKLSVSHPARVPQAGEYTPFRVEDGNTEVAARRVTRIALAHSVEGGKTKGLESEFVAMDPATGRYVRIAYLDGNGEMKFVGALGRSGLGTPELHNFAIEIGYNPVRTPEEARTTYLNTTGALFDAAEASGVMLANLETVGQGELDEKSRNPHAYVDEIADFLTTQTGFVTEWAFAIYSLQAHESARNQWAAVEANAEMQSVKPLAVAPSLGGVFIHGRRSFRQAPQFTARQQEHMRKVGMSPNDFTGEAHSWRYQYRRIGSISAGTWVHHPANNQETHFDEVDRALESQKISTIDRYFGEHADRMRWGIGPHGTSEDCSQGAYAGNPKKIVAHQLIGGAMTGSTELMKMQGVLPHQKFPTLFRRQLDEVGLFRSHRENVAVHRYGMDALVRGRPVHTFGEELLALAEYDPVNEIPQWAKETYLRSFASEQETRTALKQWCVDNDTRPSMRAYHELEIGTPSVYAKAVFEAFSELYPRASEEEIVRMVEMDIAISQAHQLEKERQALARGELWR